MEQYPFQEMRDQTDYPELIEYFDRSLCHFQREYYTSLLFDNQKSEVHLRDIVGVV